MSSISLLAGFMDHGALRWPFRSQAFLKSRGGLPQGEPALALARALLRDAARAGTPATPGGDLPSGDTSPGAPPATGLGDLIDLRATLVTRTEDASLTIRTAEGDTVKLTAHSELESLKARLTYGPGDAPATSGAAPAARDDDSDGGVTKVRLREIRLDQSVTLSVQGELSDEELADIRSLVHDLGDTLHAPRAEDGDDDAPAGSLTRIDTQGLGTLAGFELHVERSIEVTRIHVRRLSAPAAGTDPTVVPGKGPVVTPPIPAAPSESARQDAGPGLAHFPFGSRPPYATPGTAAWSVGVFNLMRSTVADLLYRRALDRAPAAPADPALPVEPLVPEPETSITPD